MLGFAGPFKEHELYSKSDGKPLRGLKSGRDIIRCTGLKGYFSCRACKERTEPRKNPDGCPSLAPTSAPVPCHPGTTPCQLRRYLLSMRPIPLPDRTPGVHGPQRAPRPLRQRSCWLTQAAGLEACRRGPKCRDSGCGPGCPACFHPPCRAGPPPPPHMGLLN